MKQEASLVSVDARCVVNTIVHSVLAEQRQPHIASVWCCFISNVYLALHTEKLWAKTEKTEK